MPLLFRRLLHALDNHGLRGLLLRALHRVLRNPEAALPALNSAESPHPFDQAHASDTSGYIRGEQLTSNAPFSLAGPDLYNTAYYAISPSTLTQALSHLPLDPTPFTFVDLGCGKGRALLVATQFPFEKIVGVELSPTLCQIATQNTTSYTQISIFEHDAATFQYPETPLVLYLYHPFLAPLLRRLLVHLEQQLRHSPRETFLLYANPGYPEAIARSPFLQQVWHHSFPLSPEDAAADRHGTTHERYTLYRANL